MNTVCITTDARYRPQGPQLSSPLSIDKFLPRLLSRLDVEMPAINMHICLVNRAIC